QFCLLEAGGSGEQPHLELRADQRRELEQGTRRCVEAGDALTDDLANGPRGGELLERACEAQPARVERDCPRLDERPPELPDEERAAPCELGDPASYRRCLLASAAAGSGADELDNLRTVEAR